MLIYFKTIRTSFYRILSFIICNVTLTNLNPVVNAVARHSAKTVVFFSVLYNKITISFLCLSFLQREIQCKTHAEKGFCHYHSIFVRKLLLNVIMLVRPVAGHDSLFPVSLKVRESVMLQYPKDVLEPLH